MIYVIICNNKVCCEQLDLYQKLYKHNIHIVLFDNCIPNDLIKHADKIKLVEKGNNYIQTCVKYTQSLNDNIILHDDTLIYTGNYTGKFEVYNYSPLFFVGHSKHIHIDDNTVLSPRNIFSDSQVKLSIHYKEDTKSLLQKGNYMAIKIPQPFEKYRFLLEELLILDWCINTIYIIHYSKLTQRRKDLSSMLERECMNTQYNIKWVLGFDREEITYEQINKNYIQKTIPRVPLGIIANGIAHNHVIRQVKNTCLILEDDMILCKDFLKNLYHTVNITPLNWEAISIGGYMDKNYNIDYSDYNVNIDNIRLFNPDKACVQTGGFLIKEELCQRIIKHPMFCPFSLPIDENLCHILPDINACVYWVDPLLAYESSKVFNSSSFTY